MNDLKTTYVSHEITLDEIDDGKTLSELVKYFKLREYNEIIAAFPSMCNHIEALESYWNNPTKSPLWIEMERELAELRADRVRLDWLQSHVTSDIEWEDDGIFSGWEGYGVPLRAAIDAAREAGDE